MEILAVIGARAGSKGLPGKNVLVLAGHPLLAHAIRTATACRHVSRVVFSSDSEEYGAIARAYGAEVPFRRPEAFAADDSVEYHYVRHAVDWLEHEEGYRPDAVVRLCPTTPLILAEDVDRGIELLQSDIAADSVILMTEAREHPMKAVKLAPDGVHAVSYVSGTGADVSPSNRQGFPRAFNRQGLPVITRYRTLVHQGSQTGDRVRFQLVAPWTALDVDTALDFRIVEAVLRDRGMLDAHGQV